MLNLLMGEASLENGFNPTSIQGIIQDEIVFCVVVIADVTTPGESHLYGCLQRDTLKESLFPLEHFGVLPNLSF